MFNTTKKKIPTKCSVPDAGSGTDVFCTYCFPFYVVKNAYKLNEIQKVNAYTEVKSVKYKISMKGLGHLMMREIKKHLNILTFIQMHKILLIIAEIIYSYPNGSSFLLLT